MGKRWRPNVFWKCNAIRKQKLEFQKGEKKGLQIWTRIIEKWVRIIEKRVKMINLN